MTMNKPEKSQRSSKEVSSKSTIEAPNSKSWFSNIRKSLGGRKNRTKSAGDKNRNLSNRDNYQNYYDDSNLLVDDADFSNFSSEFLDSFVKNNYTTFYNDNLKSKLKTYQFKQSMNPKHQMQDFLNSIFKSLMEPSRSIEKILMLVVDDYINSTCEKMLQDKMRSVYKKIENWTRHTLTRPGFKKMNITNGGNITKPEESFTIEKISKTNKRENHLYNSYNHRRRLTTCEIKPTDDEFELSSKTNSGACEKVKELKSSRNSFVSNAFIDPLRPTIEKFINTDSIKIRSVKHKEKMRTISTNDGNFRNWRNNCDSKKSINSLKSSQIFSDYKVKSFHNKALSSEFTESTSNIDSTNTKVTNMKPKEISICKCFQQSKFPKAQEPPKQKLNNKMSNNHRFLNISNVANVDIQPTPEKDNWKLFSRIPKLKMEKSYLTNSPDKDLPMCDFHRIKNKDITLHQIIRPKIRRSVTFVEPQKNGLNSPLLRDTGFCSQWDVNKSGFLTSTKSEELNYLMSSSTSIPDLCDTHVDNISSLTNHSSKIDIPTTHIFQSSTSHEGSNFSDTLKQNEIDEYPTITQPPRRNTFSPIIISLQSTPSFVGDINFPFKTEYSPENSISNVTMGGKSGVEKMDSFSDVNNSISYSDNIFNILKLESNWNVSKNQNLSTFNDISNSKNYSIIEIVNKTQFGSLALNDNAAIHRPNITNLKKDKTNISTFTTQVESVNSSCESSITDEDVLITTGSTKSKSGNRLISNLQEIILSEDDDACKNSELLLKKKKSLIIPQMRTANFSSLLRTEDEKIDKDNMLKKISPCYLSLSHTAKNNGIINPTPCNVDQINSDDSKVLNQFEQQNNKKDKNVLNNNNILKHTLASKQKMREKVPNKTIYERHPMKFSRGIARIY